MRLLSSIILLILSFQLVCSIRVNNDLVTKLENYTIPTGMQMFSGTLDTGKGLMQYILLKNSIKPASRLVIWLNGGPGCSSLLGLFQEIGPNVMGDDETTFKENKFTWFNDADLLFLESPLGVGFSTNSTVLTYTDLETAEILYNGLDKSFYGKYPEYKSTDLWVSGESYAGMYVPFLASKILNESATFNGSRILFKGIMVGNGVLKTDDTFNNNTLIDFFDLRNMLSPQVAKILKEVCPIDPNTASCIYAQNQMNNILLRVNPYDIYGYCYYSPSQQQTNRNYPYYVSFSSDKLSVPDTSPCVTSANLVKYLNNKTVQADLHVDKIGTQWLDCWNFDSSVYQRYPLGSIWLYPQLINAKLKILLYSGDTDSVVSMYNTQKALEDLNLIVNKEWRAWYYGNDPSQIQIGGYVTEYNELTFVTVRGAGHMVPQWKPEQAYYMFQKFINGENL